MAVRTFNLPDLGEGLTEGEVVRWHVSVGDHVDVDQPVAEVETAKAVVEVPCPFAGVVTERHADEGQEVEVGTAFLSIEPADASTDDAPAGEDAVTDHAPAGGEDSPATAAGDGDSDGESGSVLVGYGTAGPRRSRRRGGSGTSDDAQAAQSAEAGDGSGAVPGDAPTDPQGKPLAKPPVRKLAKDLGVDLATVTPTGPGGIITREDVQGAAETAERAPSGEAAPAAEPVGGPTAEPGAEPVEAPAAPAAADVERIPLSLTRRRIAERMTTSRREIPSATSWVQADATSLMELRADLDAGDGRRVSPLALLLRITVAGLRRVPDLNAHFDSEAHEVVRHRAVHLGVAVDTERGLLVPVIRDADRRSTLELAQELARVAEGARAGSLSPAELTGSTFTVSNYGSFGVDGGDPVINHPEVGILGVGQIAERPWVVDGTVAPRQVVELSVAFDHRVCDGGPAAQFLRFVADCVEDRSALLGAL